ncbi:LacI family DNA-binding transcriptional regulator [Demequina muriae]|uniref:LacI family DNA-binding transcriptional regulator n=1 Tax=Demequina muriae TaxID=3051664 RepID=A0ABT8GGF0_9MICO|nr:LacI family DNA-binding transcriptional regulator [Demequina sp. EGI L300058]MDN4480515.1 LacI family DNA-binding transcriptional regulator [Demequina sp. EGI L300058]
MSDPEQRSTTRTPRPTMRDVAALARVGIKTVSRVLNNEPNVTPETAERVERAAAQLNYEINSVAGNLRRTGHATKTVGLVVGHVANPFSGQIHAGVEDVLYSHGYSVLAASLDDDADREQRLVREFLRRRVDGLILTTISDEQTYLLPELSRGLPIVFVDREPSGVTADAVVGDNIGGAREATAHLIAHGHRRIACLADREFLSTAKRRVEGYRLALSEGGVEFDPSLVTMNLRSADAAQAAVTALLSGEHPPTAIFAAQNLITIGVIRALRAAGMQHAIALMSFDDFEVADSLDPGISCVTQDPRSMGSLAGKKLLARLGGDHTPASTIISPTTFIARGSGEIPAPL